MEDSSTTEDESDTNDEDWTKSKETSFKLKNFGCRKRKYRKEN